MPLVQGQNKVATATLQHRMLEGLPRYRGINPSIRRGLGLSSYMRTFAQGKKIVAAWDVHIFNQYQIFCAQSLRLKILQSVVIGN